MDPNNLSPQLKWGGYDWSNLLAESCILFPRYSKQQIEEAKKRDEEMIQRARQLRKLAKEQHA